MSDIVGTSERHSDSMTMQPGEVTVSEVCIFLMSRVGISVPIDHNARAVTTRELVNAVYQELKLTNSKQNRESPSLASLFTIWMTSPILEIQLKPLHRPFSLLSNWDQLLAKYAPIDPTSNKDTMEADQPILSFQRDVLSQVEEQAIDNEEALKLLYEEAKVNVLDGRYPIEEFVQLAGIQAAIELGPYDSSSIRHREFLKENLHQFVPAHHRHMSTGSSWSLLRANVKSSASLLNKIIESYSDITCYESRKRLYRTYLEYCWKQPYYGSAFFQGQVEKSVKGLSSLMNHYDLPVWVAINSHGIHLIEQKNSNLVLGLKYDECRFSVAFPNDTNVANPNSMPCLFVQYAASNVETKLIQIFSRQVRLMDTLIKAFVSSSGQRISRFSSSGEDQIDDSTYTVNSQLTPSTIVSSKKLNKWSLVTLNEKDECIDKRGPWKFIKAIK